MHLHITGLGWVEYVRLCYVVLAGTGKTQPVRAVVFTLDVFWFLS